MRRLNLQFKPHHYKVSCVIPFETTMPQEVKWFLDRDMHFGLLVAECLLLFYKYPNINPADIPYYGTEYLYMRVFVEQYEYFVDAYEDDDDLIERMGLFSDDDYRVELEGLYEGLYPYIVELTERYGVTALLKTHVVTTTRYSVILELNLG